LRYTGESGDDSMSLMPAILRLPAARYVVPAFCIAMTVELGLRTTNLPRLCQLLGVRLGVADRAQGGHAGPVPPWRLGPRDAARFHAARRVVGALPWAKDRPCLRTALVAARLLRRRSPAVHLGAALVAGRVAAHAWIVVDDMTLDPSATLYTNFSTPGA
jgi:hypothetical protein